MTFIESIEEITTGLPAIKTLIYADQFEANALADKLLKSEYPLVVMLPVPIVDLPGKSGILKSTVDLQLFFLERAAGTTVDYTTSEIETLFIAPLRLLARRFIHKLNEHSIVDPESGGIGQRTFTPEYGLYDVHTFGISVRASVPIMERQPVC